MKTKSGNEKSAVDESAVCELAVSLLYDKGQFFIVLGPESANSTRGISISVFNTPFLAGVIDLSLRGRR